MTAPSHETAQHEIYVLVGPEDTELRGLLARRRFRRIALAVAPVAFLGVGAVVLLVALGRGPLTDRALLHSQLANLRTADVVRLARGEPIQVPVQRQLGIAPELGEPRRAPEPLPTPAPPEPTIDTAPAGGARLIGGGGPMLAKAGASPSRHPAPVPPESLLRDRTEEADWVITLRNGSEFVVEHALFTADWVTLWVDRGVVALPIDEVRTHGRRGN